ncbi:MAG: hypothetical protein ABFD52_09055 [Acidobacteriota bacterium]
MKRVFSGLNVALMLGLIGVATWRQGNLLSGIGYALGVFAVAGILFGVLLLSLYRFVRNILNPDNKFSPEIKDRISAGLVGGILAVLIR